MSLQYHFRRARDLGGSCAERGTRYGPTMSQGNGKGRAAELPAHLPALRPQPHGGALFHGGVPGHRGGTGRPPSAIRERCRGGFDRRIKVLEEIADDPSLPTRDRIRAIDVLGKYGLGAHQEKLQEEDKQVVVFITREE